jgi:hypothetical protein
MASITTQERNQLTGLFVTMFNAAPGADHLSAMVDARAAGASLETLANNMAGRPEFQQVYPSFLTAEEFADRVVANLLPASTPSGAKAWSTDWIVSKVSAGESTGSVLLQAAQALMATDNPNYADAQALMENRIEVANHFSVTNEQPSGDLASLQDVIASVTPDPASVTAAKEAIDNNLAGDTFILTTGADTLNGSTGNDEFRALSVGADGKDATTFSAFDALDGGAGRDTLNIFSDAGKGANAGFPANATVQNIEVVNFNNADAGFGPVDASRFQGATLLNQVAFASAVTNLGAGTAAGFQELSGPLSVQAADSATSAAVALNNVADVIDLTVLATAAGMLDTVNITGTVVDVPITGKVDPVDLDVTVGKDVETLTLNSAIAVNLTVNDGAGSKTVSTVDASGSAGALTYDAAPTVANITTGDAGDTITLNTKFATGLTSASLESGAGDDTLVVKVDDSGDFDATVTVDAGEGNDSIEINTVAVPATKTLSLNVSGGAGDDTITLKNGIPSVTAADAIDGGEGTDTLVADGKALVAEDYILLTEVLTGFEGIQFITAGATIDASRMPNYKAIEFAGGPSVADKVADDQALTTSVDLTATANGYKAGPPATYAGTLDITAAAAAPGALTITANADTVNLSIEAGTNKDGVAGDLTDVTLAGDVKTANVTLAPATDNAGTPATADDVYDTANVNVDTGAANKAMTTLTLDGNGMALVNNVDGAKLSTIDASGLTNTGIDGTVGTALTLTTDSKMAESIKLGAGLDDLTLTNSTFKNMDTIDGLTLVDDAATAGLQVDPAKSDALDVGVTGFLKTTITAGSLNLALTAAAASTDDALVFAFGGNTYVFEDSDGDQILDDEDLVVKLVGTVDLDLLVSALG